MRKIEIVEYQKHWMVSYLNEFDKLMNLIAPLKPTIHHIGSTSVPGLAAKPIIDILIEVEDVSSLDSYSDCFSNLGYVNRGEFGISGRRFYQKGGDIRTHQIHVFKRDNSNVVRHLAFRDYLINHPKVAMDYATLKRKVALSCYNDIDRYCDGKNEFIKKYEKLALKWYAYNN